MICIICAYFLKIGLKLHSNLQEVKRCGDAETCTDFVISGLTHEKKDGSVVIKFDSFFRNKLAEDKLGNQIAEDKWDYDLGMVQNRAHRTEMKTNIVHAFERDNTILNP